MGEQGVSGNNTESAIAGQTGTIRGRPTRACGVPRCPFISSNLWLDRSIVSHSGARPTFVESDKNVRAGIGTSTKRAEARHRAGPPPYPSRPIPAADQAFTAWASISSLISLLTSTPPASSTWL